MRIISATKVREALKRVRMTARLRQFLPSERHIIYCKKREVKTIWKITQIALVAWSSSGTVESSDILITGRAD